MRRIRIENIKVYVEMYLEIFRKYIVDFCDVYDYEITEIKYDQEKGTISFLEYGPDGKAECIEPSSLRIYIREDHKVNILNDLNEDVIYDYLEACDIPKEEADEFTEELSEIVKIYKYMMV